MRNQQTKRGDNNVHFGSLADMMRSSRDVRFTPKSGQPTEESRDPLADDRALPAHGSAYSPLK